MPWRPTSRALLLALATALVLSHARAAVPAPVPAPQAQQEPSSFLNVNGLPLMIPVNRTTAGRMWYFELPRNPVGLLVMLHRCGRNAEDFWPPSSVCPQCIGMPESVSISRQALARGYALLAINSFNRSIGSRGRCWSWADDAEPVRDIVAGFRGNVGLDKLPLFFTGCSSGGSLALRLPGIMKMDGIMPVAIGLEMGVFPPARPDYQLPGPYPPVAYIHFARDNVTSQARAGLVPAAEQPKISDMIDFSTTKGIPAAELAAGQYAIGPDFFSQRDPMVSPALSQRLHQALRGLGVLDADNLIRDDSWPEGSPAPWDSLLRDDLGALINATSKEQLALKNGSTLAQAQEALQAAGEDLLTIQELAAPGSAAADSAAAQEDDNPNFSDSDGTSPAAGNDDPFLSPKLLYQHLQEEMGVAWAEHTNLGDYTTAALLWLERCGQASFPNLAQMLEVSDAAGLSPVRNASTAQVLGTFQACQPGGGGGGNATGTAAPQGPPPADAGGATPAPSSGAAPVAGTDAATADVSTAEAPTSDAGGRLGAGATAAAAAVAAAASLLS